jgi:hypothetical protein
MSPGIKRCPKMQRVTRTHETRSVSQHSGPASHRASPHRIGRDGRRADGDGINTTGQGGGSGRWRPSRPPAHRWRPSGSGARTKEGRTTRRGTEQQGRAWASPAAARRGIGHGLTETSIAERGVDCSPTALARRRASASIPAELPYFTGLALEQVAPKPRRSSFFTKPGASPSSMYGAGDRRRTFCQANRPPLLTRILIWRPLITCTCWLGH